MISVVIPTYKNRDEFTKRLKSNLKYLTSEEIIVVDDNPDYPLDAKKINYPNLILIKNKKNLGFAESANIGVKKAKNQLVMLINDDVLLIDNSYRLAIKEFDNDNSLFAISFAQKDEGGGIVGKNIIYWKNGLFYHLKSDNLKSGLNAWAEGGACLIDKKKFLQFGGFDSIYAPFYWEDVDLSYRAWKQGYKIMFNPKIMVIHHHKSTIGRYFKSDFIKTTAFRNQFIFIWKNITSPPKIIVHLLFLPYNLIYYSIFKRETEFISGFYEALKKIAAILTKRSLQKVNTKISDEKLLNLFNHE